MRIFKNTKYFITNHKLRKQTLGVVRKGDGIEEKKKEKIRIMTREDIKKAGVQAVRDNYNCNGKYPCEERDYCEFCNGHNSAFDCKEDCSADAFNEGFFAGANWRIDSVWHDVSKIPDPMKDCLVCLNDPMRKGWHIGRIEGQGTNKGKWNIYGYFTPALHESITRWAYIEDLI